MNDPKELTILSRYAVDRLFDQSNHFIDEKIGGPAFFLTKVFDKEKINYELKLAPQVVVDILIKSDGEFGKIKTRINPIEIDFKKISTDYLVVSTILDDFSINNIDHYRGKFFLDVQGYVRNGEKFGQKKFWKPKQQIQDNTFCLKGTEEELSFVDKKFLEKQKSKLLICTKGRLGCEIFVSGKRYEVVPEQAFDLKESIGAGDTFFGNFISKFIESEEPLLSAKFAVSATLNFLQAKKEEPVFPILLK